MLNPRPVESDSPLNRRVRVFLGIGPAPTEWSEPLNLWVTQLARRIYNWKWIQPANFHLTLRFFGSVPQRDVLLIREVLTLIAEERSCFEMETVDLALFPNANQPRIAAIKLRDRSGELMELERRIFAATSHFGQPPEQRDFVPHVTFGRARGRDLLGERVMANLWMENALPELPNWPVKEAKLFSSELRKEGSVYRPLARFKLLGK